MQTHNDVSHDMKNSDFCFFILKYTVFMVSETVTMSYKELRNITIEYFCYDMGKIGTRLDIYLVLYRNTIFLLFHFFYIFTFFECMK